MREIDARIIFNVAERHLTGDDFIFNTPQSVMDAMVRYAMRIMEFRAQTHQGPMTSEGTERKQIAAHNATDLSLLNEALGQLYLPVPTDAEFDAFLLRPPLS